MCCCAFDGKIVLLKMFTENLMKPMISTGGLEKNGSTCSQGEKNPFNNGRTDAIGSHNRDSFRERTMLF
jgi:hypothetical protein